MKCCFGERNRTDQRKTDRSSIHHEPQKQIRRESKITLTTSKVKVGDVQGEKEREEANEMKKSKLLEKIDVMDFKLDDPEGISHTPYINTFRYESILSHSLFGVAASHLLPDQ